MLAYTHEYMAHMLNISNRKHFSDLWKQWKKHREKIPKNLLHKCIVDQEPIYYMKMKPTDI